jgi:hypothetical protein
VVAWALAGLALVLRPGQRPLGAVVLAAAALGGACVLCSGILHRDPAGSLAPVAALVRPLAAGLLPAVALHLIVGLPDGHLASRPRRVAVGVAYAVGATLGLVLWAQRPGMPLWRSSLGVSWRRRSACPRHTGGSSPHGGRPGNGWSGLASPWLWSPKWP